MSAVPVAGLAISGTSASPSSVALYLVGKGGTCEGDRGSQRKRGKHGFLHGFLPVDIKRRCQPSKQRLSDFFPKRRGT